MADEKETEEDQLNFVYFQNGKFQNIRLEVENGHVEFPDTPEVAQFMRRARQRIAHEDRVDLERDPLVGDGYSEEASAMLRRRHEASARGKEVVFENWLDDKNSEKIVTNAVTEMDTSDRNT
jgi:hypothetical protein